MYVCNKNKKSFESIFSISENEFVMKISASCSTDIPEDIMLWLRHTLTAPQRELNEKEEVEKKTYSGN